MTIAIDWNLARALLEWQLELGVTEALCADPVDRFAQPEGVAEVVPDQTVPDAERAPDRPHVMRIADTGPDPIAEAQRLAQSARDLPALAEALADFPHCELRRGARSCVFADGNPNARVMIIGEGPGADEDRIGKPFVGRAGQLLDQMLAAIGLDRHSPDPARSVYIANTVPWRPPGNREPTREELAMLKPFLLRHVELVQPSLLVLVGNVACDAMLGQRGILRLRGQWTQALGLPVLPMLHPAYLLRTPEAKRETWADLLSLKAKMRALP
ncbi:MAG: uracil-DNA glycosylase [Paracoccaceae bacterium]